MQKNRFILSLPVLLIENIILYYLWSFLCFLLIYPCRKNVGEKHRNQWLVWLWNFRGEKRASEPTWTVFRTWPTLHTPKSVRELGCLSVEDAHKGGAHLGCGRGVGGKSWGKGGRIWSKCFTTWTSELWSSKESATWRKEKKKVEWLLRDFVFRAHISHSSSAGGSI